MLFLKTKLNLRLYQETILNTASQHNTLVVIPTGLGKTYIAIALAALRCKLDDEKILFMAPTKPLCVQHKNTFSEVVDAGEEELAVLTGAVPPDERKKLWENAKIVFATPQTVTNDVLRGLCNFENFPLVIFDEAHRAIGDYAYVWLAKIYLQRAKNPRILALTASPASEEEKLNDVCSNLFIQKVEMRQEEDSDVKTYVQDKEIKRIDVVLPEELEEILGLLEKCLKQRLEVLHKDEVIESARIDRVRKKELLLLQGKLAGEISSGEPLVFKWISIVTSCIKLLHAKELLETQGIKPLVEFYRKLELQARTTKASRNLLLDWNFRRAMVHLFKLYDAKVEHPKYEKLKEVVKENLSAGRIIIFTQYRSSVDNILKNISLIEGVKAIKFIGQKEGMSQKKQVEILDRFKAGEFNVLVATSISEEGLHIENADVGIFFEPIPSALRAIQRRGRIGRVNLGKVFILVAKGTIDEKYYWVARHKEKRMNTLLHTFKLAEKEVDGLGEDSS